MPTPHPVSDPMSKPRTQGSVREVQREDMEWGTTSSRVSVFPVRTSPLDFLFNNDTVFFSD